MIVSQPRCTAAEIPNLKKQNPKLEIDYRLLVIPMLRIGLGFSAFARHYLRNHIVFFSSWY
jgi:hypothetical protein